MYVPYFRGKQFELLTIREMAGLMSSHQMMPIIEPVRSPLRGLEKALGSVLDADGHVVVIVNPEHGDHRDDQRDVRKLLDNTYSGRNNIVPGLLLRHETPADDVAGFLSEYQGRSVVLVHAGFTEAKGLHEVLSDNASHVTNVFTSANSGNLYRRHFQNGPQVLLHDGFKVLRNADYPPKEVFSELHVTYRMMGLSGFGDFLIVGDKYSESGGPAYAVAIHLTFIDEANDDQMYTYHFVSDTKHTPTDPAGKFAEALDKLVETFRSGKSQLYDTTALQEFVQLHEKGHFPGLGYVKKLSMNHHIETLARYLGQ